MRSLYALIGVLLVHQLQAKTRRSDSDMSGVIGSNGC